MITEITYVALELKVRQQHVLQPLDYPNQPNWNQDLKNGKDQAKR